LGYLARIYFGLFSDTDKRVKPVVRLTETIGEARTTAALRGFKAITQSSQVPAVGEIAAENIQHRRWDWWYAIIAGLEERWSDEGSIEQWSDELVASGLAIELLHTIYQSDGNNTMRPIRHEWKARTLRDRSQLAHRTYVTIAETALAHDEQYIPGLRELLDQENLATFRTETVLYFLRKYPNAKTHYLDDLLKAACGSKRARGELVSLAGDLLKREGLSADNYRKWLTIAYLIAPVEFQGKLSREQDDVEIVWLIRDRMQELSGERSHIRLTPAQLLFLAELATKHFPTREGYPSNGWSGDRNPWDGTEFVLILINRLSADPSQAATDCLVALDTNERLVAYGDNIKHALANQLRRRRDAEFRQPSWYQAISTLSNREPANVSDLHALLVGTLKDLTVQFRGANNDVYKRFWNEDQYGRPTHPKPEESCRDVLLDFLRTRLTPLRITAEPEGHMVRDKRADISVQYPAQKVPIELKRDYHGDVWHAAGTQLDRLYSLDPDASGFGIYGVFWFGKRRPVSIPTHPNGAPSPQSSQEMESMLSDLISPEQRSRLAVIVLDVSGDVDG
jgi:hypothetical protein